MVFLLIVVAAGVQAEARWNGAQRMQKGMTKSMAKKLEEKRGLKKRFEDVLSFKLCFWTPPNWCVDQLDIILDWGDALFLPPS